MNKDHNVKMPFVLGSADELFKLAFNNSLQANIISIASNTKIIRANKAAGKLLGYSSKELLTLKRKDIFVTKDTGYKAMLRQRAARGYSSALLTAVKKKGITFPCLVTSAVFRDVNGIEYVITSLVNSSKNMPDQKNTDAGKEIAANIVVAKTKQKAIDKEKRKVVADNIILAQSKYEAEKRGYEKLSEEKMKIEIKLKEQQIAEAMEDAKNATRSDIGKELHDNINQLLAASRLYIEMANRGGKDSKMHLSRSSEYIHTAIEEIRKLTKGLASETIINVGLCKAIENIAEDCMEVSRLKISFACKSFSETSIDNKFKLNIYRVIQEQLNNVLKHARAKKVHISLLQNKVSLSLTIKDDGIGFDTRKKQKGIGIDNIKSRAKNYNGTADFISAPGKGCILKVVFPK